MQREILYVPLYITTSPMYYTVMHVCIILSSSGIIKTLDHLNDIGVRRVATVCVESILFPFTCPNNSLSIFLSLFVQIKKSNQWIFFCGYIFFICVFFFYLDPGWSFYGMYLYVLCGDIYCIILYYYNVYSIKQIIVLHSGI